MQAPCASGAAREDVGLPRLVPRSALAGAYVTNSTRRLSPPRVAFEISARSGSILLANVENAVPTSDDRAGRAKDAVARRVISPAAVTVPPGPARIIGPHRVPLQGRSNELIEIPGRVAMDDDPRIGLGRSGGQHSGTRNGG